MGGRASGREGGKANRVSTNGTFTAVQTRSRSSLAPSCLAYKDGYPPAKHEICRTESSRQEHKKESARAGERVSTPVPLLLTETQSRMYTCTGLAFRRIHGAHGHGLPTGG